MKLNPSPQLERSIEQFNAFILTHWKQQTPFTSAKPEVIWQQALNDQGWNIPDWPVPLGGTDWSAIERYHWYQATCRAGCPQGDILAKELIGPLLFNFGEPHQMFYLDGIRAASDLWGLARLQTDHQLMPIHMPANATKILVILERGHNQSSLMIAPQPEKIPATATATQISKDCELLGKINRAHTMMTAIQLRYQPIAAICRTAGVIAQLEPLLDRRDTTAQEQQSFSEILIAQQSIEIYCQRILADSKLNRMPLITRSARNIMNKIKELNQSLSGYYSLTEAQEPGDNSQAPAIDTATTDLFEYCEPLDLLDSFTE